MASQERDAVLKIQNSIHVARTTYEVRGGGWYDTSLFILQCNCGYFLNNILY
jgi:hypothetical protein